MTRGGYNPASGRAWFNDPSSRQVYCVVTTPTGPCDQCVDSTAAKYYRLTFNGLPTASGICDLDYLATPTWWGPVLGTVGACSWPIENGAVHPEFMNTNQYTFEVQISALGQLGFYLYRTPPLGDIFNPIPCLEGPWTATYFGTDPNLTLPSNCDVANPGWDATMQAMTIDIEVWDQGEPAAALAGSRRACGNCGYDYRNDPDVGGAA